MSSPLQRKRRLARALERELGHDVYTRPHDPPTLHAVSYLLAPYDPPSTTHVPAGRKAA